MDGNVKAVVETISGKIEGRCQDGLYVFKGIPYAAPPVLERRWAPPAPVKPWVGVRNAFEFARVAPQARPPAGILDVLHVPESQDEDCLYLNVWSPALDDGRRPVLVWIHGGAFTMGSGSQPFFDGRLLSSRGNVVVVTINYRLGVFGFLNLNGVTGGRVPATGNEGLLDQVSALQWVRDNIAAFGGDPANVTVFGQSAGGMSIGCLLAMPAALGLFHKAILQSGVTVPPADAEAKAAERLIEALGVDPSDRDALAALPVEKLLAAEMELRMSTAGPGEPVRITATAPAVDGKILPLSPLDAVRQGFAAQIPLLIGTNLEEWKLFGVMDPDGSRLDDAMMAERLKFFLASAHEPDIVKAYHNARTRRGDGTSRFELLSAILSDFMFRMPALRMAESQQLHGTPVYSYLFTWTSPALGGALGACHALDLGFVFGTYDDVFCGKGAEADRLSRNMQDGWIAFARTGDPSCEGLGTWPRYGEGRSTMILGKECFVKEAPYDDERRAWSFSAVVAPPVLS
jgi:para-nitrobenzyl esterase